MSLESVTKNSDNDGSRIDASRVFQTRRPWTVNDGHVSERIGLVRHTNHRNTTMQVNDILLKNNVAKRLRSRRT